MELQKIINIFEEHGFNENNCSFFRQEDITEIAKDVLKAINYTHCCETLNEDNYEHVLTFKNGKLISDKFIKIE